MQGACYRIVRQTGVKPASVQFSPTLLSKQLQIKEYWDYRDSVMLKRFASGATLRPTAAWLAAQWHAGLRTPSGLARLLGQPAHTAAAAASFPCQA